MASLPCTGSIHNPRCADCAAYRAFSPPRLQSSIIAKENIFRAAASCQDHHLISSKPRHRILKLQATKIEDLAAAHQYESNISPPAALICIPTSASSIDGVLKVTPGHHLNVQSFAAYQVRTD